MAETAPIIRFAKGSAVWCQTTPVNYHDAVVLEDCVEGDAEAARDALIRQVSRPVRWQLSIERMVADGASLFVEIGPGKVLCGMLARIDKGVRGVSVQTPADFEAARAAIAETRAAG